MPLSLPPPDELERRARLVALLDALLAPDSDDHTYEYDPKWAKGERLFSMRSGEGDQAFVWFGKGASLVRGKCKAKKAVPKAKLFGGLPKRLEAQRDEPAFDYDGDSFATWSIGGGEWRRAADPSKGGMQELLGVLDGNPKTFVGYARRYYEVSVAVDAVAALYDGVPVTPDWLARLSIDADLAPSLAIAKRMGVKTQGKPPVRAERAPGNARFPPIKRDSSGAYGDAEFTVVRRGDDTLLVVGGRVQLRASKAGLYVAAIEKVREILRDACSSPTG